MNYLVKQVHIHGKEAKLVRGFVIPFWSQTKGVI